MSDFAHTKFGIVSNLLHPGAKCHLEHVAFKVAQTVKRGLEDIKDV